MKKNAHEPARKDSDLLTTVARSIGSTLGVVAAKVSSLPPGSGLKKRAPRKSSASGGSKRAATKNKSRRPKNRKKS